MNNQAESIKVMLDRVFLGSREKSLRQAWAEVFSVNASNTADLFHLLFQVSTQVAEIRSQLLTISAFDPAIVCSPLADMENFICFPNIDTQVGSMAGFYNDKAQMALTLASSYYTTQGIYVNISDDDLKEITDQIEATFRFISESDIDSRLKETLLDLIETVRRAIAEFRIRGNSSLQDVLDYSLGKLLRLSRQSDATPQAKVGFTNLLNLLAVIDKALAIAQKMEPYLPMVTSVISTLSSTPPN